MLYYRSAERRQRKPKIEDHGVMTCDQAREVAQRWLLETMQGRDPSLEKQETKKIPLVKELADRYMREHAPRKKATSAKEDGRLWVQHILPVLGHIKVSAFSCDKNGYCQTASSFSYTAHHGQPDFEPSFEGL